jgi:aldoxime dehydratase
LIRSGQDWGDASPDERDLYTKHIEPVLRAGMNFLETQGSAVGCYSNRFVQDLPEGLAQGNKTYGMSLWRSLGHLEEWSSRHKTHLAIFAAGMKHMKAYGADAGLRTYHEISVLEEHEQFYEYVSCHPQTSLLNALSAQPASSPQSAQSSADAVEGWLSSVREADQAGSARGSAGADVGRQVLDT